MEPVGIKRHISLKKKILTTLFILLPQKNVVYFIFIAKIYDSYKNTNMIYRAYILLINFCFKELVLIRSSQVITLLLYFLLPISRDSAAAINAYSRSIEVAKTPLSSVLMEQDIFLLLIRDIQLKA